MLEKLVGIEGAKKIRDSKAYMFWVDALAMNLFSLIYIFNDKFMGEKEWDEAGATRLTAAIGNTITGRPYGIFRDWTLSKFKVNEDSHWFKKYLVETATFAVGQSPLYAMYLAGGDMAPEIFKGVINLDTQKIINSYQNINPSAIKDAVIFLTLLAPALGSPQGWTYEKVREKCGLEPKP